MFCTAFLPAAWGETGGRAASATEETWSAACSSKIEHLSYPADALDSKLAGSVSADFAVDSVGRAVGLALSGPVPLADSVRDAIEGTMFPAACRGEQLKIAFSFEIPPDAAGGHQISACFSHPPNTFSVTASRIKILCSFYSYVGTLVKTGGIAPVTVCELLANPVAYDGKDIALLGKFDDSHFDGQWLSEDNCGSNLVTDGYAWPNKVAIGSGSSGPTPPLGLLVLDPAALNEKLESVRRTTILNMEELPVFSSQGPVRREWVQQNWAVIFGRIEARNDLRPPRRTAGRVDDWGNGFGQMGYAPAQIDCTLDNEFYIREAAQEK